MDRREHHFLSFLASVLFSWFVLINFYVFTPYTAPVEAHAVVGLIKDEAKVASMCVVPFADMGGEPLKLASIDLGDLYSAPTPAKRDILQEYREVPLKPCTDCQGLTTLTTKSGLTYSVAAKAAHKIAAFVHWLEVDAEYKITDIGGFADRTIAGRHRWSNHKRGTAVDINQNYRNVVTAQFPKNTSTMAAKFGLESGADWSHPDTGHFELVDSTQYTLLGRTVKMSKRHHRYHHKSKRVRYASNRHH